jgi:acyl carrier protein
MDATLERIKSLAASRLNLEVSTLTPETRLDSLGVDSLGLLEFLFELEDEFHVKFPQERDALQTVGDLMHVVQSGAPAAAH